MPNHVTCELRAAPKVLDALAGEYKGKPLAVDLAAIIPAPAELYQESLPGHAESWAEIALGLVRLGSEGESPAVAFERGDMRAATAALQRSNCTRLILQGPYLPQFSDADFEAYMSSLRSFRKTGHLSWYTWNTEHWGTKWNAYESKRRSPGFVRFQTAWSPPLPVIAALSARFPKQRIAFRWADEDRGYNVGRIELLNGERVLEEVPNGGSEPARALAAEILGKASSDDE